MRALVPLLAVLALSAFVLSGCDTAEERAEAHYQRALALLADGDADRAKVEFRNVFRLDGAHVAARLAYAAELDREGETREAYGQYLRVVDQDPKNLEAYRARISGSCGARAEAVATLSAAVAKSCPLSASAISAR